jgi:hypothetical protein
LRNSYTKGSYDVKTEAKNSPREIVPNKIKIIDIEESPLKPLSHKSNRVTYL